MYSWPYPTHEGVMTLTDPRIYDSKEGVVT